MTNQLHNSDSKIGIIFIHGAGLGGWIWDDVIKSISLPYICADYTSLKRRDSQAKLADYVDVVYEQAQQMNVDQIVIVAHSIGGIVGIELSKRLGDRVVAFIAVSASIPKPGKNFVSTLPFPQKIIMPTILKFAGTKPPESVIRSGLCSDVSKQWSDKIVETFSQESVHLYTDKTSANKPSAAVNIYIKTIKDREFDTRVQSSMIQNLDNAKIYDIPSGHLPMLSHPMRVSEVIASTVHTL